jgi:hypothetical protein
MWYQHATQSDSEEAGMLEHLWQQIIDGAARLKLKAKRLASILMVNRRAPAGPQTKLDEAALDERGSTHA